MAARPRDDGGVPRPARSPSSRTAGSAPATWPGSTSQGRVYLVGRTQGHDPAQRGERRGHEVEERAAEPPGGPAGGGARRARRAARRGDQGVRRRRRRCRASCATSAPSGWRRSRCRATGSSATTCRCTPSQRVAKAAAAMVRVKADVLLTNARVRDPRGARRSAWPRRSPSGGTGSSRSRRCRPAEPSTWAERSSRRASTTPTTTWRGTACRSPRSTCRVASLDALYDAVAARPRRPRASGSSAPATTRTRSAVTRPGRARSGGAGPQRLAASHLRPHVRGQVPCSPSSALERRDRRPRRAGRGRCRRAPDRAAAGAGAQLLDRLVLPYPVDTLVDAIERAGQVYLRRASPASSRPASAAAGSARARSRSRPTSARATRVGCRCASS